VVELSLTKPQIRLLLQVLDGPSVESAEAATLYHTIKRALDDAAPTAPWRKVVGASGSAAWRGNGCATNLKLECGHTVRMNGETDYRIKRLLEAGKEMKRRCRECAGGPPRMGMP
jgi:hypothetical protein